MAKGLSWGEGGGKLFGKLHCRSFVFTSKNVSNSCKNTDSSVLLLKVSILKVDLPRGMASCPTYVYCLACCVNK